MTLLLQIWDFNLGQLRVHDDSDCLEYSASEVGCMMKSYGEFLKEASTSTTREMEPSGLKCSIVHDDMAGYNVSDFTCMNPLIS